MKYFILVISHFVFIFNTIHAQPQLKFIRYKKTDGLINNDVLSICQDKYGFLWFGTKYGCSRFDGTEFKNYEFNENDPGSISEGWVKKITIDKEQRLWFAAVGIGGSMLRYDYEKDEFVNISSFIKDKLNIKGKMFEIWNLYPDRNGCIWTKSPKYGFICYDPNDNTIKVYNEKTNEFIVNPATCDFSEDDLWFTSDNGIFIYSFSKKSFFNFKHDTNNPGSISSDKCRDIFKDSNGDIWIATFNGLNKLVFSEENEIYFKKYSHNPVDPYSLSSNLLYDIDESNDGNLLVATVNGLCILDRNTNKIFRYFNNEIDYESPNSNLVRTLFKDKHGNIWIGTDAGIGKLQAKNFSSFSSSLYKNSISHNKVQHFCELPNSDILIATPKGIDAFDRKNNRFSFFLGITQNTNGLYGAPLSLHNDGDNGLWIGTWNGGLSHFDFLTKKTMNYIVHPETKKITNIFTLFTDSKENLWISSENQGAYVYNKQKGVLKIFSHNENEINSLSSNYIFHIDEDSDSTIWIGTMNGLNKLVDFDNGIFKKYLQESSIKQILHVKDDTFLITSNTGLYRLNISTNQLKRFDMNNGLPDNSVYSILEDARQNYWISTGKGLSKIKIQGDSIIHAINYHQEDGINTGGFLDRSCIKLQDGTMMFGGTEGFCMFHPSEVVNDTLAPKVVFTNLKIANKSVQIGQKINRQVILEKSITVTTQITLNYKNNAFSIQFAGLQYNMPKYNQFKYKLFGYENDEPDWIYVDAENSKAEFVNLPSGEYTLKVFAANSYGIWGKQPAELNISILKPWWSTYWFISFVIVVFVLMMIKIVQLRTYFLLKQKQKLEKIVEQRTTELMEMNIILKEGKEEMEQQMQQILQMNKKLEEKTLQIEQMAKQLHDADQSKLKFFANISHEFRTPLSLIIGPLENILSNALNIDLSKLNVYHKLMHKNAKRLLRLINQIIDFRKIEQGAKKLSISNNNIIEFITEVVNAFQPMAEGKGIQLTVMNEELRAKNTDVYESNQLVTHHSSLITQFWFDPDIMEKILFNLISNAIKYTPYGGVISIAIGSLETRLNASLKNQLAIEISDTGIGIKPENLNKIFGRFYREYENDQSDIKGTGIGLAYTKELVDLHKGTISVESAYGDGATFIVSFPLGKEHYSIDSFSENVSPSNLKYIHSMIDNVPTDSDNTEASAILAHDTNTEKSHHLTILVVEDNNDLRAFLRSELSGLYQIYEATNGKEGWELVLEQNPDMIISDIMMPVMDGIELCKKVKTDEQTSHIPIILLTAKSGETNVLEGYETGADDYISKPFNMQALKLKLKNFFTLRERMQNQFNTSPDMLPSDITHSVIDNDFLENAMKVVHQNLEDPDFDNEAFVENMNYSRALVYKKIKSITNQSLGEFINSIRIKAAAKLFNQGHQNIKEVSYNVGFKHPNILTRHFKKTFGVPPSEYLKNISQDNSKSQ